MALICGATGAGTTVAVGAGTGRIVGAGTPADDGEGAASGRSGDANSSALVTLPEREDYKYVVMPMRI